MVTLFYLGTLSLDLEEPGVWGEADVSVMEVSFDHKSLALSTPRSNLYCPILESTYFSLSLGSPQGLRAPTSSTPCLVLSILQIASNSPLKAQYRPHYCKLSTGLHWLSTKAVQILKEQGHFVLNCSTMSLLEIKRRKAEEMVHKNGL